MSFTMISRDRARIDICRYTLIRNVNFTKLWPKLMEYQIFLPGDVNIPQWERDLNDSTIKMEILMAIKTRGPLAFDKLLKSLTDIDQVDLAAMLVNSVVDSTFNNNPKNISKGYQNLRLTIPECGPANNSPSNDIRNFDEEYDLDSGFEMPVQVKVRKSTRFQDEISDGGPLEIYQMRSRPRGLVLLITLMNYKEPKKVREAAEYDHNNLKELFEQMGFTVIAKWDLSAADIKKEVVDFSRKPDHSTLDCCFVIITGHGGRSANGDSVISGIDDVEVNNPEHVISYDHIIDCFSTENCPALSHKPKIFIFQSCRGASSQFAIMDSGAGAPRLNDSLQLTAENTSTAGRDKGTRNFEHILIVNSTLPGYVSFRNTLCGSWFIQSLCYVFMRMACSYPIQDLFSKIDQLLASIRTDSNQCQTTTVKYIGFFKRMYLNPGLFLEDNQSPP
ncbi:caspase b-like [Diachasmimorpha longicaudata]|uniref:caspase b-like n=1 Tax=Diachasmimorpha longicaudata TaxID=58733 RepID=UPI0030B8CBEC